LTEFYALGSDINAAATADPTSSWGSAGFIPIGNNSTGFSGTFQGLGHSITGLKVNPSGLTSVGMFASTTSTATISNVGLIAGTTTSANATNIGGLVGLNQGSINKSYNSGTVSASTAFVTFSETTAPGLTAFGDSVGTIETDPADSTNKVMKVVKSAGNVTWAGVTISKCSYPTDSLPVIPLTTANKTMSLKVYSTVANKVLRLKLENAANNAINVEMDATVTAANTWQTLTFDITQIANNSGNATRTWLATDVLNKASVFADFGNSAAVTMYVDDLKFIGTSGVAQTCMTAPVTPVAGVPSTAATTPTVASTKALSVYSDAYTAIPGVNLNPGWGQSTAQTQIQVVSDNVLKHANLNYQGFSWEANAIDVSTYTNLHIDLWSADATSVKVFVISAGQDTQSFTVPITASTWVSQDIALSNFSLINKAAVIQVKLESVPFGGTTVYMDNLYFWKP
jgi:hypothetical protein